MAKKRPLISSERLWRNAEARLTTLLLMALELLRRRTNNNMVNETSLNRELYFCLQEANRILHQKKRHLNHLPIPECPNAPSDIERERHKSESKIPDFKWQLIDHQAPARQSARYVDIECKRLGNSGSPSWPLNENYVNNGIHRFRNEDWRYGWSSPSGFMIGYVQNMHHAAVLVQVNTCATSAGIAKLTRLSRRWKKRGISKLTHKLTRSGPHSPFLLQHYWLDLRDAYSATAIVSAHLTSAAAPPTQADSIAS